jgi:hypothetical protein
MNSAVGLARKSKVNAVDWDKKQALHNFLYVVYSVLTHLHTYPHAWTCVYMYTLLVSDIWSITLFSPNALALCYCSEYRGSVTLNNSVRAHKGPEMWTQPCKREAVSFFLDIVLCGWIRLFGYNRKNWVCAALCWCNLDVTAMVLILLHIAFCSEHWEGSVLLNDAVSPWDYVAFAVE